MRWGGGVFLVTTCREKGAERATTEKQQLSSLYRFPMDSNNTYDDDDESLESHSGPFLSREKL